MENNYEYEGVRVCMYTCIQPLSFHRCSLIRYWNNAKMGWKYVSLPNPHIVWHRL